MSDFIIIDGDIVNFMPSFPPATVVVLPGTMAGSGKANFSGKPICVEGDEEDVEVPGCMYISGGFVIPGVGTLKIQALNADQIATKTNSDGKKLILKGSMFTAVFEVQTPAQQPTPTGPVPDPAPQYTGQGQFVTTNSQWTAT